jgi:hypothetical protein
VADRKSLVIDNGQYKQIPDADSLIVGAGIKSPGSSDLTITPGGTNIVIASSKNLDVTAGTLDMPTGANTLINGVALVAGFTAANINTLLNGSNADALHNHAGMGGYQSSTGWTTAGVSAGELCAMTATDDTVAQADASSASGDTRALGILITAGEIAHIGLLTSVQLETGLTTAAGDRLYMSKTAGAMTNDISGFSAGDTAFWVGNISDDSAYVGTTPADSKVDMVLLLGEPVVL